MRSARLKAIVTSTSLLGLVGFTDQASANDIGRFPKEWTVLPEDRSSDDAGEDRRGDVERRGGLVFRRGVEQVDNTLDRIFVATAESLETSGDALDDGRRPPNPPPNWTPWHLKELYMDLGINLAGTAGIITAIGEGSCEIRWVQPKADQARRTAATKYQTAEQKRADLEINDHMSAFELETRIDQIADVVMATGKVENRDILREGLLKSAQDLKNLMVDVNRYNDSRWEVSRFGVDVDVAISGGVGPGTTLGGAVRLRFEWVRSADRADALANSHEAGEELRESLRQIVGNIARDISSIGSDPYSGTGFDLKQFKVGLGIYASARFAVVRGRLGVTGFAFFSPTTDGLPANGSRFVNFDTAADIPLLETETTSAQIQFADQQRIKHMKTETNDGNGRRNVFMLPQERFKKGLERAVNMGSFFARRAAKSTNDEAASKRWQIDQVKPAFALSLQGITTIFTIGAKASMELTFRRSI